EPVADAGAGMGALDQAGNVGKHELAAIDARHAKARMQGGEGIIGDLRLGGGDARQEGRLAGIGQADQPGIGDQLQAQPDGAFLSGLPRIGAPRCLVGRRLEMHVAETAIAAAGEAEPVADLLQVADQRLAVFLEDLGSGRYLEHDIGAARAGAVAAHAVHAGSGLEMLLVAIVDQRVESGHRLDPYVAAVATIAAVGSAEFDELLPPERDTAGAAVARTNVDLGRVKKFHGNLAVPSAAAPAAPTPWSSIASRARKRAEKLPPSCGNLIGCSNGLAKRGTDELGRDDRHHRLARRQEGFARAGDAEAETLLQADRPAIVGGDRGVDPHVRIAGEDMAEGGAQRLAHETLAPV